MPALESLHEFAISLSAEAGDTALNHLQSDNNIQQKGEGIDVVTSVDVACEKRIIERIQAEYPDHGITGEEHGIVCRPEAPIQWLIDPLDGTTNFLHGLEIFSVSIALATSDHQLIWGLVIDVMKDDGRHLNLLPPRSRTAPNSRSRTTTGCAVPQRWAVWRRVAKK